MPHAVLLLTLESADAPWSQRLRSALPGDLSLDLRVAPTLVPPPDARGWLAILVDCHLAQDSFLGLRPAPAPLLWLGNAPNLAALPPDWSPSQFLDLLDRAWPTSKLAFVLRQNLGTLVLRRLRNRNATQFRHASPDDLQGAINNALTGLLGNAALAADAARKLPAPLQMRLQRIVTLGGELRDLLAEAAQAESHPHASHLRAA